jgi:hypothetical protein
MMPLKIGFTGTKNGMTFDQKNNFLVTLDELNDEHHLEEFHHGDCIGADEDAHQIVETYFPHVMIHIHPPENGYKRAFCKGGFSHQERPFLVRNRHIVDLTDVLIATPDGEAEHGQLSDMPKKLIRTLQLLGQVVIPLNNKMEVDLLSKKKKVVQICSRTVEIVKEETKPMVNFCIAAASAPVEILVKMKKEAEQST